MLDCGIHPGYAGDESLPFFDHVDPASVDLLLVTHFHLDHAGALPYFTERTSFKGRIFMTHPTKAVLKMMIADYVRIGYNSEEGLYSEADVDSCLRKIEIIDFHQSLEIDGIKFRCYNAGHVLGGAMFTIEIAGVNVLYTGDYSREDDRHLMAAETPNQKPNVLIVESTYGKSDHESAKEREARFLSHVEKVVNRGGRCLIPVFALGRAQELLLLLEEHWEANPELQRFPIYYASRMADRALRIYQTYVNMMNEKVRARMDVSNPFHFRHIHNLRIKPDDDEPCVVMASPGMLQSGMSRQLFEKWCGDRRNSCIIPGYAVEGTLAKTILGMPEQIAAQSGRMLPRRCDVQYVSFSAHADYSQTSEFVRIMEPDNIVLVHGAKAEMNRLQKALLSMLQPSRPEVQVMAPRNTHIVSFEFRTDKIAKVIGSMADNVTARRGRRIRGIFVTENFSHRIMAPADLPTYTNLSVNRIRQRQHIPFHNNFNLLTYFLRQVFDSVEAVEPSSEKAGADGGATGAAETAAAKAKAKAASQAVLVEGCVTIRHKPPDRVLAEWAASPTGDMIADACVAIVMQAASGPASVRLTSKVCCHGAHEEHTDDCGHEHETVSLEERQQQVVYAIRGVLRNMFKEIDVDLLEEDSAEGEIGSAVPKGERAALKVVVDGVGAVLRCNFEEQTCLVYECDDKAVGDTLSSVGRQILLTLSHGAHSHVH